MVLGSGHLVEKYIKSDRDRTVTALLASPSIAACENRMVAAGHESLASTTGALATHPSQDTIRFHLFFLWTDGNRETRKIDVLRRLCSTHYEREQTCLGILTS